MESFWEIQWSLWNSPLFKPTQKVFQHTDLHVFKSVRVSLHSIYRLIKNTNMCNKNILAVILESIYISWGTPFTIVSYDTLKIHKALRGTLHALISKMLVLKVLPWHATTAHAEFLAQSTSLYLWAVLYSDLQKLGVSQKLRQKRKITKQVNFSSAKDITVLSVVIKKRRYTEYQ